jgi:hypothetical protein
MPKRMKSALDLRSMNWIVSRDRPRTLAADRSFFCVPVYQIHDPINKLSGGLAKLDTKHNYKEPVRTFQHVPLVAQVAQYGLTLSNIYVQGTVGLL